MKVRECFTEIVRDESGEAREVQGERWVDMPDVLTEAEGKELDRLAAIEAWNASIRAQLAENDASRGVRAIAEALGGDNSRLLALQADQAALRAQLKPVQ